jgi:malate dehydrogenase (oxaloacetate-decarboxylating)(NADP+)
MVICAYFYHPKITKMAKIRKSEALDYHSSGKPGKIEVIPSKPYRTQRDLSLAYSPGVAEPCIAISENKQDVYKYTAKGNLVAVISNGTAVLGLGDIGPEASKPVMEGKGLLFKIFADIDVFDIEVDAKDVETFVATVKAISPTFGGINLEDIKAPECFEIERRLKEELDIPVMHDDQHGTAIITSAALLNALELAGKSIQDVKIVVNGAGASAVSCAKLYVSLGAKKENIVMLDSQGVIKPSRGNLSEEKAYFANEVESNTLEEAIKNADVFLGLSKGNILSQDMIKSMANNPIVFACANPDPEIAYQLAIDARKDIIMATGRSDHPNQVNNVLGFPFLFRGALDVQATTINEEMKLACVKAIAELAKEVVPEEVNKAYGEKNLVYGRDYIIPKPMDPRLITIVAPAVAKAAMDSGVAKISIKNWTAYKEQLSQRMGHNSTLMQQLNTRAKKKPKKVVFAEADSYKVLKAAQLVKDDGVAEPILLGNRIVIEDLIEEYQLDLTKESIIDTRSVETLEKRKEYGSIFFEKRKRRGVTIYEAENKMRSRNYYAAMMVELGEADAMITGVTRKYRDSIKSSLEIIGVRDGVKRAAGMYIIMTKNGPLFLSDITINVQPTAEELVEITVLTHQAVKQFNVAPRIALLSYSNFGSSKENEPYEVRKAIQILHRDYPEITVDGEIQANFALNPELLKEKFPFTKLGELPANTLIFPNLSSGNIAYKLIQEISGLEVVGPILLGMKKSTHILQLGSSVREIVNMATLAVVDAQLKENNND